MGIKNKAGKKRYSTVQYSTVMEKEIYTPE